MSPHDTALLVMTVGAAVGTLLMADAAEEASRKAVETKRRRALFQARASRLPMWLRPAACYGASLAFLFGMTVSGALLVGAFPR